MLRNPLFYRVICLFLVVYQKNIIFVCMFSKIYPSLQRYSAPLPTE